jgi:hypothetical protein
MQSDEINSVGVQDMTPAALPNVVLQISPALDGDKVRIMSRAGANAARCGMAK